MTRSRQDPRIPPQTPSLAGSNGPAPRPPDPSADNQMAIRIVGLAVLVQMLRSRRLYEGAAFAAIVLAALAGLNQESRAKALARLTAWVNGRTTAYSAKLRPRLPKARLRPTRAEHHGFQGCPRSFRGFRAVLARRRTMKGMARIRPG